MMRWIVGILYVLQACTSDAAPTRSSMLQSLVKQIAAPEVHALVSTQRGLTASLGTLERTPSEAALAAAQSAWRASALGWVHMEALRLPVNDDGRNLLRASFWPTRSAQLEDLLRDGSALDPEQIETLGVDVRGVYALEWLLFAQPAANLLTDSPEAARTRKLASALAHNVEQHALELEEAIGSGATWAAKLTQDDAAALSRLVNITTAELEQLASERLGPALTPRAQVPLRASELRGGYSAISSELVRAQFGMLERMYVGDRTAPGIVALLKPAAPNIEQHVRGLFQSAHAQLAQLDAPLDQLAQQRRAQLANAQTALKELERALKTEASSALGVTLTFESSDGD